MGKKVQVHYCQSINQNLKIDLKKKKRRVVGGGGQKVKIFLFKVNCFSPLKIEIKL